MQTCCSLQKSQIMTGLGALPSSWLESEDKETLADIWTARYAAGVQA